MIMNKSFRSERVVINQSATTRKKVYGRVALLAALLLFVAGNYARGQVLTVSSGTTYTTGSGITDTYSSVSINSGGTDIVNGVLNAATDITAGGLLSGTGTVNGTVSVEGTISPAGAGSIGVLTTGALTLSAGGTYYVDINAIPSGGTAGTNWDELAAGAITNNATSGSPFTVSLNGTLAGFSNTASYTWPIGTFTGTAPSASNTIVNTTGLTNTYAGYGKFSIAFQATNIDLLYSPQPTVTVIVGTYIYNGTPQGPNTATNTGTGTSYTFSYTGTGSTTYGPSAAQPTNAGTYTVIATVAADGTNIQASSAPTDFAINTAPLTIAANNLGKCTGAAYLFTGTEFTTNGLFGSDAVSSVSLTSAGSAADATTGTYTITASAAVGTGLSNYVISYTNGTLAVETLILTMTQVNPDCYNNPGSLSGAVTGGTAPYMYTVNTGLTYNTGAIVYGPSANPLYSPVAPGYYTYSATDSAGCLAIAARLSINALTQTPVLMGTNTAPVTTQVCYGGSKTISTTPIGGATPYTYSLNTNGVSGPFVASANRYFYVPAGTYYITVKDNVGCTYNTDTISITQPSAGVSFTTSIGGQACNTLAGIVVTAAGGYGGYTYSDDGGSTYQTENMFSGLAYGSYTIAVKDQNGCAATPAVVKFSPLTSSSIAAAKNPICPGSGTTIYTVPSGGTAPYSYSLDGLLYVPSNSRYFYVPGGQHTITVKDNVSCTYGPLSITIDTSSASCAPTLREGGTEELKKLSPSGPMFEARLMPNPTQSTFHLQLQSSSREDVELLVMNMLGVKVYESKGGIDNTYEFGGGFISGVYILQVRQGNEVHTMKLVKGN